MARHLSSTVEYCVSRQNSLQLMKATSHCCSPSPWSSTAPRPAPEASVCTVHGLVKFVTQNLLNPLKPSHDAPPTWPSLDQTFWTAQWQAQLCTKFGTNHLYHPASPKKNWISFLVWGCGQSRIASFLSFWGLITTRPRICPRYCTSCWAKTHFLGWAVSPAWCMCHSTSARCLMCSSQVALKIMMSSRYAPIKAPVPSSTLSINLWKVAGAPCRPNGITLN